MGIERGNSTFLPVAGITARPCATTGARRPPARVYDMMSYARSLTRAAACEWGHEGIRTNVILPHARSPGMDWWIDNHPDEAAEFIATIPQRRVGHCETDIGRFVAVLCSDASAYVNGQSIALDGGQAFLG